MFWSTVSLERNVCKKLISSKGTDILRKMELPSHSRQSFRADRKTKEIVKVPPAKTTEPAFTCSKLTIEKGVKYVQS